MSKSIKPTPAQQKAIKFGAGTMLVVAGAGTGKTRVITERIKYLIEKKGVKPEEILALTFTEKASGEMLDRIGDVMPLGYEEPYVYTFHSFADRILKQEGLEIGLDTGYKILPDTAQWLLLRKNLFKFDIKYFRPLGNPTKFISAILKFISRLQDENISHENFKDFVQKNNFENMNEKMRWMELGEIYKKYQDLKITNSKLDFGDLIFWNIKLFKERSNILAKYQKQFKHVLVDEFQDTNYAQYELIKLLFPNNQIDSDRSLMVVGDDSQSIYKFRGAAISNILEFRNDYPTSEMVTLTQNFRSTQSILDASYKLVKNNDPDTLEFKLGISKKLSADGKDLTNLEQFIYCTENLEDEVDLIITKILEILGNEPEYTYKDFAILARANSHLDPFVLGLKKYGLPYQLVGNRGLYDQEEIRNIMAMIKIIADPSDNISLYRALNINTFNISPEDITRLLASAKQTKTPLWEVLKKTTNPKIEYFLQHMEKSKEGIAKLMPSEFIYQLLSTTDYLSKFIEEESVENELKLKNIDIFYTIVKRFEVDFRSETKELPTILNLIEYLDLMIEAGENPAQAEVEDIDTINLMTTHSSKGLEFPVVFMVNLVSDRFPTRDRKDQIAIPEDLIKEILPEGDPHIQEERRLFYVGMTRAKKYLHLTYSKNYGGKRDKTPSGFLKETGLRLIEITTEDLKNKPTQNGLFGVESQFREPVIDKLKGFTPDFLSYTQISSYKNCPLQYKYNYILKIPTPPNHALSFGNTVHETLRDFHSKLSMGEKVTLDEVLKTYENKWDPVGYMDEDHKKEQYKDGLRILTEYYDENIKNPPKTKSLEQSFNIKIDGIRFYGRIDRIDQLPDGSVEIIDYKTGKTKEQSDVDKDDQVSFYAMGAIEGLKLKPTKLSMYFVETGTKITTTRTPEQIQEKREETSKIIERIKTGEFEATPSMMCSFCDYREICPKAYKS